MLPLACTSVYILQIALVGRGSAAGAAIVIIAYGLGAGTRPMPGCCGGDDRRCRAAAVTAVVPASGCDRLRELVDRAADRGRGGGRRRARTASTSRTRPLLVDAPGLDRRARAVVPPRLTEPARSSPPRRSRTWVRRMGRSIRTPALPGSSPCWPRRCGPRPSLPGPGAQVGRRPGRGARGSEHAARGAGCSCRTDPAAGHAAGWCYKVCPAGR